MKEKTLSALSMARGAGKLKIGLDASKDAVMSGAPLVIIAEDTSDRTRRAVKDSCGVQTEVLELRLTQQDIAGKFGWRFGVAAVTDNNFADLVRRSAETIREGLE